MINSPKINSLSTFLKQQQKTVPRCGAGMSTGKPRPCSLRVECPLAGCICKAFAACFPRLAPCGSQPSASSQLHSMHTQTTRNPPQTYAVAVKEREASLQAALGETLHLHKLGARLQTPAKECYSGTACSATQTRLI